MRTILHCRKSLLYFQNEVRVKKSSKECFDVTMGSYDGAEICVLVGLLILDNLSYLKDKNDAGLYRDDGRIFVRNKRGRSTEKLRNEIVQSIDPLLFLVIPRSQRLAIKTLPLPNLFQAIPLLLSLYHPWLSFLAQG